MGEESLAKESKPALPTWARIVLAIISYVIMSGIFQLIVMLIAGVSFAKMIAVKDLNIGMRIFLQLSGLLSLILVVYIFRRFIDKKSIMSMGFDFKNRFPDIGAGFIVALLIIGGGSIFLNALNYIDIVNISNNIFSLFLSFNLFIIVALNEEILVRGYILNNLMSSMNKYLALILSAVLFGSLHFFNPNFSLLAMINIVLAGILLGSVYIFTKNLWFPISLHLFWNFIQGPIFGYSVSGQKIESMFKVNLTGNSLINGGEFGFEGSIVCAVMLIVAIILIMNYYIRKTLKQELITSNSL